ncbi:hypothetical protein J6P11_05050 [bacterium]|nr:hypothetical protein [bacterium]
MSSCFPFGLDGAFSVGGFNTLTTKQATQNLINVLQKNLSPNLALTNYYDVTDYDLYGENNGNNENLTDIVQDYLFNELGNYYQSAYINVNYDNQSINYKISTFISQIEVTKTDSDEVVLEIDSLPLLNTNNNNIYTITTSTNPLYEASTYKNASFSELLNYLNMNISNTIDLNNFAYSLIKTFTNATAKTSLNNAVNLIIKNELEKL